MNKIMVFILCAVTSGSFASDLSFSAQMRKAYEEGDAKTVAYLQQQQNTNLRMNAEEPPQTMLSFLNDLNTRESDVTQMSEQLSELTLQKTSGPIKKNNDNKRKVRIKNPQGIGRVIPCADFAERSKGLQEACVKTALKARKFDIAIAMARKLKGEDRVRVSTIALHTVADLEEERSREDVPRLEAFKTFLHLGAKPTRPMVEELFEQGLTYYIKPILDQRTIVLSDCQGWLEPCYGAITYNEGEADEKELCQIMTVMAERGLQYNEKLEENTTILMAAACVGKVSLAKLFLNSRANIDINQQDDNGDTALMYAAVESHAEMVKLLLAHGARLDLKDGNGKTALNSVPNNGKQNSDETRALLEGTLKSMNSDAKMSDEDGDAQMSESKQDNQ